MGDAESKSNQLDPAPVSPGRFGLFRYWFLDHRDRELRWTGFNEKDGANPSAVRSFRNWPARSREILKHDLRLVCLLVAPALISYIGILSLIAIVSAASKWLLPRYFGPDPHRRRTIEEVLTGVALGIAFYFLVAVVVYLANRLWYWKWVVPEMARSNLRRGKCAACKYFISNLRPASDGCTVCPECGAAWKLHPADSK